MFALQIQKEKKMRKLFTLTSLLVALTIVLTACGGSSAATQAPAATEPPAAATQPSSAATEAPAATQAPATGEKVTLTIESWRNDDLSIWQDKIIPAFEAK